MKARWKSPLGQFVLTLGVASLISIGLYAYGAILTNSLYFGFFIWNLFLAWLPLVFALRLQRVLTTKAWSSWEGLLTSFLWLIFLPNSFYMVSDYIHLKGIAREDLLYMVVMFTAFIFTCIMLGFASLYIVHQQLKRRLGEPAANAWVSATILLCSIAIYLGRDLRWNSWDILVNPGGLLFDVSERLLHISEYPRMVLTIASFFILISTMYYVLVKSAQLARSLPDD